MLKRKVRWTALAGALFLISGPLRGAEISVEGGPMDTGFNSGTLAYIHATVRGLTGQPKRYVVFAEIQYYGTTSSTSVEMDRLPETKPGVEEFQVGWPIPPQAPTGFYTLTLHVDDRIEHSPEVTKKVRGFVVYKKLVRISRVTLDKTIYNVGEQIKCEVGLENLSDTDMKGLRVEFSNANYPWISLYSQGGHENPDLAIRVLREHLDIPAGNAISIPMITAGTATFLRGKQREVMGAGMPLGEGKNPPPEVDMYTVALWNADRTRLYDMQFSPPAIVRTWDRDLPKPYSRNFTHPYNSFIDFTKYREFYAPGQISAALRLDSSHTLYRPGDTIKIVATLRNTGDGAWNEASLQLRIRDLTGKEVYSGTLLTRIHLDANHTQKVPPLDAWTIPSTAAPGTYLLELTLTGSGGNILARTNTDIALNELPASLLVICAHEDDETAYTGLMRAAVEAGIPVHLLTLTAGDVGACERYYDKPCGPNEAREFGTVRLEETAEVLEHLGIARDNLIDLGLPDGGSGAIWFEHKDSSNPFLSIYLACDHAPYENVYKPNLPYARDAVVEAIRQIIINFHPAMIALTGPDERHVDHRTANWFAIKACQALLKEKALDPRTLVLADQVYGAGGFKPAPYKYESFVVHLSGEAAALRQEVTWIYQSQDGNLAEGNKKTLAELPREEKHLRIMDWQEHEGWNEQESGH
jgi:LmbE family N-acetylglucosaminyl deacetylase